MNRRGFFATLAGLAAAAILPFRPSKPITLGLYDVDWITQESLRVLSEKLNASLLTTTYTREFLPLSVGDILTLERPAGVLGSTSDDDHD